MITLFVRSNTSTTPGGCAGSRGHWRGGNGGKAGDIVRRNDDAFAKAGQSERTGMFPAEFWVRLWVWLLTREMALFEELKISVNLLLGNKTIIPGVRTGCSHRNHAWGEQDPSAHRRRSGPQPSKIRWETTGWKRKHVL